MVPDPNGTVPDVYLWDATTGTARLSDAPCSDARTPVISDDGQVVVFTSGRSSVCVWDASTGTASRIGLGRARGVSSDGSRVLFTAGLTNVFVWDATTGSTTLVTDRGDYDPRISSDGRYVAYSTDDSGLADDTNGVPDVLVWDAATGQTTRITDGDGPSRYPDISAGGRYVAFLSEATNLVPGQTSAPGVFVWDAETGMTRYVALGGAPAISDDGRYVALAWWASDLVPGDTNEVQDVFLWDARTDIISRLTEGDGETYTPAISADGNAVTFESEAANLTDDDPDGVRDVFLWRRTG
jgi:Tol biopolymer transport system component